MSKTFEQGREEISRLCGYFGKNRESFCAPGVKEAHVRQSLIDPFFVALGWDVSNAAMIAPQYREVIPEDSLDVEGQQKAPDYSFRVGTLTKFFTEAKKCGVNLHGDPAPAYQLRRYGWSAKVAVSLLTDFEELGVYDCTARPKENDKASHARVLYFTFDEYADRWREIWDVFSREAVWSGAFDQYAASKRKRGTSEVDAEFLKEIEEWREDLARNFALRNKSISTDDLNAAVQLTIDRIVFLRMAEDRGLEPYEQLLKLCERPDIYTRFMRDVCRRADEKYNSGLFHFQKEAGVAEAPDRITPGLEIDDKVFKPILEKLYFANGSPYHFGVLPVEILGTVYERFLGKVIRLTAGHQAKIEEKPEVRKAGGVYYTPAYIVDYIVEQTVGQQANGKSPAQLAGGKSQPPLRVLDMACGSGSFLLGAYQYLLDHCLKWYIDHKPETHKRCVYQEPRKGEWRLTIEERKRILTTHIFGVDIDRQAVEVSKLSLLLKALEGENDATLTMQRALFHERALPNLSENIKCGNSLIGPDYFTGNLIKDPEELKRVNAFDWNEGFPDAMKAGGFDCVIGNPPYVRMELFKDLKEYLRQNYESHDERTDLYVYFIERSLALLSSAGTYGVIVSNKWIRSKYGAQLRNVVLKNARIVRMIDFGELPVFQNAATFPVILVAKKRLGTSNYEFAYTRPFERSLFRLLESQIVSLCDLERQHASEMSSKTLSIDPWRFGEAKAELLLEKMKKAGTTLSIYTEGKIRYGIKTGLVEAFIVDDETRKSLIARSPAAKTLLKPYVIGDEVRKYRIEDTRRFLIYTHHGVDVESCKSILKHLEPFRIRLLNRATKQEWYELQQPQQRYVPDYESPKIVYPDIAKESRFALDTKGLYPADTTFIIPLADLYLLGILNSRLVWFYLSYVCPVLGDARRGGRLRLKLNYVKELPLPVIDEKQPTSKVSRSRIIKLVESMLALQKQLAESESEAQRTVFQRQIDATDAEINRLVYELYGLTDEEIAIVEGGADER